MKVFQPTSSTLFPWEVDKFSQQRHIKPILCLLDQIRGSCVAAKDGLRWASCSPKNELRGNTLFDKDKVL